MTEQNYRLIREAMNDCYNVFYTKWAKKSLLGKLTAEDWLIIVDEAKTVAEKYSDTIAQDLATKMVVELTQVLERGEKHEKYCGV